MRVVPKQVSVAGVTIKVVRRDLTDIECYGQYDDDKKRITLCTTLRGAKLWGTFRHELLHAALAASGVAYGLPEGVEEVLVRGLENIFFPCYERHLTRKVRQQLAVESQPPKHGSDLHPD
ncbi:MAG: hypothetical protein CMJ29_12415 [Phycisphaerae bacterium]|nr:hypothetical protein [Phycisphaerae bacterium]